MKLKASKIKPVTISDQSDFFSVSNAFIGNRLGRLLNPPVKSRNADSRRRTSV